MGCGSGSESGCGCGCGCGWGVRVISLDQVYICLLGFLALNNARFHILAQADASVFHYESEDINLLGFLAYPISSTDSLGLNSRVPLRGNNVNVAILLKVESFAARADLEEQDLDVGRCDCCVLKLFVRCAVYAAGDYVSFGEGCL